VTPALTDIQLAAFIFTIGAITLGLLVIVTDWIREHAESRRKQSLVAVRIAAYTIKSRQVS